jgi:zinc transport system permease protein
MVEIFDVFRFQFVQNAFVSGTVIAIIAPLVGIFLVNRRYSALADTLAHVSLVGVAGALVLSTSALWGALISSILATLGIDQINKTRWFYPESLLILFITGSLGVVSILSAQNPLVGSRLESFLFGTILTTTRGETVSTIVLGSLVFILIVWHYRSLFDITFSEDLARVQGVRVGLLGVLLSILSAVVVSLGIQIVGGVLVSSLMVVPVLTATNFRLGFKMTLILSLVLSLISMWGGMLLSFSLNFPPGGVIVLVNLGLFLLSLAVSRLLRLG